MVRDVTSAGFSTVPRQQAPTWTPGPSWLQVAQGVGMAGRGQSGMEWLQQALNAAGANPPLSVDGLIGPKTEAALKAFQQKLGVEPTGRFGLDTLVAMQNAPGVANIGDWNRAALGNTTGGEYTPTAPHVNDGRPAGTIRAGDLARAEDARRLQPVTGDGRTSTANAPWISQFDPRVPGAGDTACYRACREMMRAAGVNIPAGTGNRIQVANGENGVGAVQTTRAQTDQARSYIDQQLAAGKPVTVGVSHKDASYNQDGITDHFVVITGRGTDERGRQYYTYNDPATQNASTGRGQRFYVDQSSGNLVHEGSVASGYVVNRHTELSMVIRNP
jgi:peptidoglycan hydrolase-like protein with peptidoglycan-binding domain